MSAPAATEPPRGEARGRAGRKSAGQITAHLCASERAAFHAYAQTFALDPAGLLALLLSRELRIPRLVSLLEADKPPGKGRTTKVTAHGCGLELRRGLVDAATACGVSVSYACAVVIRAELRERWLERAIMTRFESAPQTDGDRNDGGSNPGG